MGRDPAFLFYDGDASRDVSHMNRLERGCYFDLIQAQRKFGHLTVVQARKILGKDFDACWDSIEMVLTKDDDGKYFIFWLDESIHKRNDFKEKQRKRIQDYWDKKKETDHNHGDTVVLPLEEEDVNEIGNKKRKTFNVPKFDEIENYCTKRKNSVDPVAFWNYYQSNGWMVGKNKMKDWMAAIHTWEAKNGDNKKNKVCPRCKGTKKYVVKTETGEYEQDCNCR